MKTTRADIFRFSKMPPKYKNYFIHWIKFWKKCLLKKQRVNTISKRFLAGYGCLLTHLHAYMRTKWYQEHCMNGRLWNASMQTLLFVYFHQIWKKEKKCSPLLARGILQLIYKCSTATPESENHKMIMWSSISEHLQHGLIQKLYNIFLTWW
jgi:hypothetical protein